MPAILVVDDERIIADTLALILSRAGYAATSVYSGAEALAYLSGHSVDLVLSDVVMPGMNGIELATRVQDAHPSCRVILISGNAMTHDLLEGARARGYSFMLLAKPIPPLELLNHVKASLTHAGASRRMSTSISVAA